MFVDTAAGSRSPWAPRPGPCLEAWPGSAAVSNRAALVVCVSSWLRRRPPALRQVPPVPCIPAALVSLGLARPGPACPVAAFASMHLVRLCAAPSVSRPLLSNVARNSLAATSNHELASLQLQRLWAVSKSDRGKLCASFAGLAPVTARRLRGKALRALRRPPHRRRCVADVWLGASSWSPPWPRCPPILLRQFRMQFPFRYFKL